MSGITSEVVALIAKVWHRFEPSREDADTLAGMLAPMDDAGEELSARIEFDGENLSKADVIVVPGYALKENAEPSWILHNRVLMAKILWERGYAPMLLMSGGKQRYGSQVRQKEDGTLVVWKLEDPDRVDELRKRIGLPPLREYLAAFGEKVTIER